MAKQIKPDKIYSFLKKYYNFIFAGLAALLLVLSFLIYFQYIRGVIQTRPDLPIQTVKVDQETLGKVLDNIKAREENLIRVQTKRYFDPFND